MTPYGRPQSHIMDEEFARAVPDAGFDIAALKVSTETVLWSDCSSGTPTVTPD
jgi:hypothetical protein